MPCLFAYLVRLESGSRCLRTVACPQTMSCYMSSCIPTTHLPNIQLDQKSDRLWSKRLIPYNVIMPT